MWPWPSLDYWLLGATGLSPAGALTLFAAILTGLALGVGTWLDRR